MILVVFDVRHMYWHYLAIDDQDWREWIVDLSLGGERFRAEAPRLSAKTNAATKLFAIFAIVNY